MLYTPELGILPDYFGLPSKYNLYALDSPFKDLALFYVNNLFDVDSVSSNLHWPSIRDYMRGTFRNLKTRVDKNIMLLNQFLQGKTIDDIANSLSRKLV